MSEEDLNQHFSQAAVTYLREFFRVLLSQKLCANQSLPANSMSKFKRIRIFSATVFQLPDTLTRTYQDSSGSSNTVGKSIWNTIYSVVNFRIYTLNWEKTTIKHTKLSVLKP